MVSWHLPKTGPSIVFEFRDKSWLSLQQSLNSIQINAGWCMGGTLINRKKGTYWLGNLPTGIHIPTTTNNTTYLRVHGEKGYKKYYGTKKLTQIKKYDTTTKNQKEFYYV